MPLETFTGASVPRLLARAQAELGVDAVIVQVNRSRLPGGSTCFQLTAADPATAGDLDRVRESAPLTVVSGRRVRQPGSDQRVLAVVGPTGAGKTTTVTKLATHEEGLGDKKVGLLCLDTHRTGAVDQLRVAAKTWRLPLAVAYEPSDLKRALKRLRKQDVILVDTPGCRLLNGKHVGVVNSMLRQLQPSETHLVVPAGLSGESVKRLVTAYRPAGVTHVLVTKLDEFPDDSCAFEVAAEALLPVRWVACGQRVPQDLRLASNVPSIVVDQLPNEAQLGATVA